MSYWYDDIVHSLSFINFIKEMPECQKAFAILNMTQNNNKSDCVHVSKIKV